MELLERIPAYKRPLKTIEEYLADENQSTQKHEYYNGEVFAMAGAGSRHNLIFSNLFIALGIALKGTNCQPYGSDLRIHIPEKTLFTYSDISIICGDIIHPDEDEYSVVSPTVIIEILSPATKNYDRGEKFKLYRDIKTLRNYVLIDSALVWAEVFSTNESNLWELKEYKAMSENVLINSVQLSLYINDIYAGTKLP